MAKFDCVFRTSYFYVTDEKKYEEFKRHIVVGDNTNNINFWHKRGDRIESDSIKPNTDEAIKHAFGGHTQIKGYVEDIEHYDRDLMDPSPDYDLFLQKLSEIVAPGSACIITEVGNNGLRFIGAKADIVTHKNYRRLMLRSIVRDSLFENEKILYNDSDMWF